MYNLPTTDLEFTQFAMEHSGHSQSFYARVLDHAVPVPKMQVREWVKQTCRYSPKQCRTQTVVRQDRPCTQLYIAGVLILTANHDRTVQQFAAWEKL